MTNQKQADVPSAGFPNSVQTPSFYNDLESTRQQIWRLLERGVGDRKSSFHTPAIGTISIPDGTPSIRTVILRAAEPGRNTLSFHTDSRSAKYAELSANPAITVHVYDAKNKIQVRMTATACLHHCDDHTHRVWNTTRPQSLVCYRQEIPPGTPISSPLEQHQHDALHEHERVRDEGNKLGLENFVILEVTIHTIEWLYLAATGHRRALFTQQSGHWKATWLAP
ncbi:MAG: pyridoxamine 5'-phosphate oxidase family protein [Pseudomonadota bacterium]